MAEVPLETFFARQVELLESGDLDALLERYLEDAVLLRVDRVAHGRAQIRALFEDYLRLSRQVVGLDGLVTTGDSIAYAARLVVEGVPTRTFGAFVLRDGRIHRQFATFDPPLPPSSG